MEIHLKYISSNAGNVHVRRTHANSRNHNCPGKAISVTYSECVSVAHAPYYILSVASPALPFF